MRFIGQQILASIRRCGWLGVRRASDGLSRAPVQIENRNQDNRMRQAEYSEPKEGVAAAEQ
jgi:hypothetical protein